MPEAIRVDDEVYAVILAHKHELESQLNRTVSLSNALKDLLNKGGKANGR